MDAQGKPLFTGETDWKAYQVRLWNPCVLRQNDDGTHRRQRRQQDTGLRRDSAD